MRARAGGFEAYVNASRGQLLEQASVAERGGRPNVWKKGSTTFAWTPPSWASLTDWSDAGIEEVNPSDALEDGIDRLCSSSAYTGMLSCISQRSALSPGFVAAAPGFAIDQIAADCLHPVHGSLGTEYMTDLLVEWTMALARDHALKLQPHAGHQQRGQHRRQHEQQMDHQLTSPRILPPSVFRLGPRATVSAACCIHAHGAQTLSTSLLMPCSTLRSSLFASSSLATTPC